MMKPNRAGYWCFIGLILLLAICWLQAEDQTNPYQSISERNVFNLKPPPDPADNTPPPPPPPLTKVTLTGITSIFGPTSKRALLEIEESEPGKPQQKNIKKPIMREGEREGDIEVISIDLENYTVKIRNGNVETNLVFETPKMAAAAPTPAPGTPGAMPLRPGFPGTGVPGAPMNPMNPMRPGMPVPTPTVTPTIISRDSGARSPYGAAASGPTAVTVNPASTPTRAPFPYRSPATPTAPIYPGGYPR